MVKFAFQAIYSHCPKVKSVLQLVLFQEFFVQGRLSLTQYFWVWYSGNRQGLNHDNKSAYSSDGFKYRSPSRPKVTTLSAGMVHKPVQLSSTLTAFIIFTKLKLDHFGVGNKKLCNPSLELSMHEKNRRQAGRVGKCTVLWNQGSAVQILAQTIFSN